MHSLLAENLFWGFMGLLCFSPLFVMVGQMVAEIIGEIRARKERRR